MQDVLAKLNIPTKAELDALRKKIEALSESLDTLAHAEEHAD